MYVHQNLALNAEIVLQDDRSHYLRHVLRLRPGSRIAVFNGRDGEWLSEIGSMTRRSVTLTVLTCLRRQAQVAESDLWLAFAPLKRARLDYVAQKATELGVICLWPVLTRFTMVQRVNTGRLAANAVEAAEQCGRLAVPEIRQPVQFADLLERWPPDRWLFCCDETGAGIPIIQAVADHGAGAAGFLIGPEGGFADTELDRLDNLTNVCRVSLGARILRADTAAVAALACWQAVAGDRAGGDRQDETR